MRIGVFADSHVSVSRFEPASWHNPYRLVDSCERLARALAHPLLADAELLVGLGDLVHFGDAESLTAVVETVAAAGVPTVLVSGNHDVLEEGVRLEQTVDKVGSPLIATPIGGIPPGVTRALGPLGVDVIAHEIVGTWPSPTRPFEVVSRRLHQADGGGALGGGALARGVLGGGALGRGVLALTHFPLVSLRQRAKRAGLLYAGHLADLADPNSLEPGGHPTVVLSGHLHLRGVATQGEVLQIVFAALVEDPYDIAVVDLEDADGGLAVGYECVSVHPSDAARVPVLDPARGRWVFRDGRWARTDARPVG